MGWDYTSDYKLPERKIKQSFALISVRLCTSSICSISPVCKRKTSSLDTTPQKTDSSQSGFFFFFLNEVLFIFIFPLSSAVIYPFKEN